MNGHTYASANEIWKIDESNGRLSVISSIVVDANYFATVIEPSNGLISAEPIIAIDNDGEILATDNSCSIRKISTDGSSNETVAGSIDCTLTAAADGYLATS